MQQLVCFFSLFKLKATIHTVVARGAGVRFHESSAEPLRVWENCMKNPGKKSVYGMQKQCRMPCTLNLTLNWHRFRITRIQYSCQNLVEVTSRRLGAIRLVDLSRWSTRLPSSLSCCFYQLRKLGVGDEKTTLKEQADSSEIMKPHTFHR